MGTEGAMSATGLEVFDTTLHKTNAWLNEIMNVLGWSDRHKAYLALRATLHAVRDRLTVDEAAQFAAQLPMLIRGLYYEGWDPTDKPLRERRKEQFLARIAQEFWSNDGVDPDTVARGVFAVLAQRITEGELLDVQQMLPGELRDLWPGVDVQAA
jgi:uncharacterized protein (DUF2267 family)